MKKLIALLALVASVAIAAERGPAIMESPLGTDCRSWVENGATYLEITNTTDRDISGTVTLNEIYEKVIILVGGKSAEIDGRWIEVELSPKGVMKLRLGK